MTQPEILGITVDGRTYDVIFFEKERLFQVAGPMSPNDTSAAPMSRSMPAETLDKARDLAIVWIKSIRS